MAQWVRVFQCGVALGLSWIAVIRTDFSLERIHASMEPKGEEFISSEVFEALQQPYRFLDRGRQAFAFVSADEKFVLKFFDQNYLRVPWYARFMFDQNEEIKKRNLRKKFFLESYRIAERFLLPETALLCVHLEKEGRFPQVTVTDRANRSFVVDLSQTPFVLQRKVQAFYPFLEQMYQRQGKEGLFRVLEDFLRLVEKRIAAGLSDLDHDIEMNFGVLDGRIIQLDPGRLMEKDLSDPKDIRQEWWRATHRLLRWLQKKYPEEAKSFEPLFEKFSGT